MQRSTIQDDFIELYPGALPPADCRTIIEAFEAAPGKHEGRVGEGVRKDLKDSRDLTITGRPEWREVESVLNKTMMWALCQYLRRYPHTLIAPLAITWRDPVTGEARLLRGEDIAGFGDAQLANFARAAFRPGSINVQGYSADSGGYPYWHCEQYPKDQACEALHRVLLWTLYLNDDFDEGETEFLYQQRKVKPETGALVIAPAAFTHTHRGNRPKGGDKYIATSWVLFKRAEQLYPS